MHRYAFIDPSNNSVIEKRTFPAALAANTIKHVGGLPLLRPIEVQGMDLPCEVRWQQRVGPVDQVLDDKVIEVFTVADRDIEAMAAEAKQVIDARAEVIRLRFITPGSGQAMVYQAKMDEAKRWQANNSPAEATADLYPLIAAEVGVTGNAAAAVVQVWSAQEIQWRQLAAQIELIRLTAKAAIETAKTAGNHEGLVTVRDEALADLDVVGA